MSFGATLNTHLNSKITACSTSHSISHIGKFQCCYTELDPLQTITIIYVVDSTNLRSSKHFNNVENDNMLIKPTLLKWTEQADFQQLTGNQYIPNW